MAKFLINPQQTYDALRALNAAQAESTACGKSEPPKGLEDAACRQSVTEQLKAVELTCFKAHPSDLNGSRYNDLTGKNTALRTGALFKYLRLLDRVDGNVDGFLAYFQNRGQVLAQVPIETTQVEALTSANLKPETGLASYYGEGDGFDGRSQGYGGTFRKDAMTIASRTLRPGTPVEISWTKPDGSTVMTHAIVTDWGPHSRLEDRIADLSWGVYSSLTGGEKCGLLPVTITPMTEPEVIVASSED